LQSQSINITEVNNSHLNSTYITDKNNYETFF